MNFDICNFSSYPVHDLIYFIMS